MRLLLRVHLVALLGLGACDDGAMALDGGEEGQDGPRPDAAPCWELRDPVAKGTVFLGTGYDEFETMTDELPIEFGSQNGFNVVAHVQMQGLVPGDPANVFDPSNPRTRVLAYFADGRLEGVPLSHANCPFRAGYKAIDGDTFEMARGVAVIFDICWRAEDLLGRKIRIKLEVLDAENGYSTDERVVTMVAPASGEYPSGESRPACLPPLSPGIKRGSP